MSKDMIGRLDPELAEPLKMFLNQMGGGLDLHDIPAVRAASEQMLAAMKEQMPVIEGVTSGDRLLPGPAGAPDVAVRIYQKTNRPSTLPALLWIHGGGYVLGSIEQEDMNAKLLTLAGECLVVSVDYRLAPENPFPAPVEDCYAALKWLASHAGELGVDPTHIAIGGASAGGGLASGLALLARDRAEVDVAFQFLIYPMIDDCNVAPASEALPDTLLWTRESNLIGWRSYLGCEPGGEGVSPYAAAMRATDLTGLPPAYIAVGELDLFLNENVEYARRLIEACVPTELHVYPGACHGFDMVAPDADVTRQFTADFHQALKRALHR
ncbi:MAG: alpha/beta hydrolase [Dehalococcoidales bacterium]|nr:alpha/beta hydrolase [Dehalococcoidales bacterium]